MSRIFLLFLMIAGLLIFSASCKQNTVQTPHDVLGIYIGMSKADVDKHLPSIANFVRRERKRQEVWLLREDKHFHNVAVGYDQDDRVRYVTAFVPSDAAEKIRYDQFGDLNKAAKNPLMGNQEFAWEMPAQNDRDKYVLIVRGIDPNFANALILKRGDLAAPDKEDE